MKMGLKLSLDLPAKYHESRAPTLMVFKLQSRSELSKEKGIPSVLTKVCNFYDKLHLLIDRKHG